MNLLILIHLVWGGFVVFKNRFWFAVFKENRFGIDCFLTNLISGCPELEEVYVERLIRDDNLEIFKVSSPFLKRLGINFTRDASLVLVVDIDASKIEYVYA